MDFLNERLYTFVRRQMDWLGVKMGRVDTAQKRTAEAEHDPGMGTK